MSPSPPKQAEEEVEEVEEEEEEMEEVEEVEEVEEEIEYEEVTDEEEEESEADEEQNPNPNPKPKPSVPESIASLQSLNGALSDFLDHYNSLLQTLDSINSSRNANSGNKPIKMEAVAADDRQLSELESICRNNNAKALRKYIIINLTEIERLRREVPKALKLSRTPEKLVLDAIGRFYMQGIRAYQRGDSSAIRNRRASILLLEFYVFAGCPVAVAVKPTSAFVKESAREAAVSWRNRLISEGGLETAKAVDALGLVLLVASFGVPSEFGTMELYSLLRLSNLKKKRIILRRSAILVQKIPDIIKDLIDKDMHVEAVDLVCKFGLEEKFPPVQLLSSFVKKGCEVGVVERREDQCSLRSSKEANEKQLAALKSVVKCLEDHKLDATELASLKIHEKIAKCEKGISKAEIKLHNKNAKRKFEDVDPLRVQDSQAKQLWPSAEAPRFPVPQSIRQSQDQGIGSISDYRYAYSGYTSNNVPVSSEASHGLVDRKNLELRARNVHGPAVGWRRNTGFQSSVARIPYSSGYDYTRYSAAAGENIYQPPASGQNIYQTPASGQNIYQQPAPGQNMYQQPASQKHFYQPPASSLATGGGNLLQFADTVSERKLHNYSATSNPVATASTVANPSHQSS